MVISRRALLKSGGIAMIGMGTLPAFLQRAVANTAMPNRKKLIVLFQRGAADGLNIVVPFAERDYYRMRPSIAIPQPRQGADGVALDLDGFFGLHPSLSPLLPLFQKQQLAIVHATGSPDTTRSHFDAQDYMESGTPGIKATEDGWLNRSLQTMPEPGSSPFRAVAMGANLPMTLRGSAPAVALADVRQFRVISQSPAVAGGFEALYAETMDKTLRGTGAETFEAIEMLRKADPSRFPPENGAVYPGTRVGQTLQQVAQLHKANIGLEVTFVDTGGWDNHVNQGGSQGQLANLLRDVAQSLAAFTQDMGDRMEDVVVVTMSEFGRTAHENGNRGTDHGHANCMFVIGGAVNGGKVYGKWPGLAPEQLNEGRDLKLTSDFRSVLGEIISRHLGNRELNSVFPRFENDPRKFPNLIKT
jgi:uncharacterized protein (DUF1501 family)